MTQEADTIWEPVVGAGEYSQSTAANLVDPTSSAIDIVDPSGVFIVDTGLAYSEVPATVFVGSPGE